MLLGVQEKDQELRMSSDVEAGCLVRTDLRCGSRWTLFQLLNLMFLIFKFLFSPSNGDVGNVSLECRRGLRARVWVCKSVWWLLWAEQAGCLRTLGA